MQIAIAAPKQNYSLQAHIREQLPSTCAYYSCSQMYHSAAKINLTWCTKDTATKSCMSPSSCFYLYSFNVITTETVTSKSNNSHLVLWFSSTATSDCEPKCADTSERECTSIYLHILTKLQTKTHNLEIAPSITHV
jgi:hypothetical protein